MTIQECITAIEGGADINSILASGATVDLLHAALKERNRVKSRAKQTDLDYGARMPKTAWQARKAWLKDGVEVYGDQHGLADFYFPAKAALEADDQEAFSRYRDLLFKAVGTVLEGGTALEG